jgi:putative ABC transport system permease protein
VPLLELLRLLTLRRARRAPLRALLVALGLGLGVAAFVGTRLVGESIRAAFSQLVTGLGGRADLLVTAGEGGVPAELVETLARSEGVRHAAGKVEVTTRLRRPASAPLEGPVLLVGVELFGDPHFSPLADPTAAVRGLDDPLVLANDPRAILLGAALAARVGVQVGGEVEVLAPAGWQRLTVRGLLLDEGAAGAFGGQVALMFVDAADLLFERGGRLDVIELALAPDRAVEARRALEDALEGRARVESPGERGAHLLRMVQPMEEGFALAGVLALLVGMFLIYNTVSVLVSERLREVGTLRALGLPRAGIVGVFGLEALVFALFGVPFGLWLAERLARAAIVETADGISRFYAPIRAPLPALTPETAGLGAALGLAAALLAALGPAWRASRLDPVAALRARAAGPGRAWPRRRGLAWAALSLLVAGALVTVGRPPFAQLALFAVVAAALLLIPVLLSGLRRLLLRPAERLFGAPARLGLDAAERSLGRSAVTVGALLVAVSATVCVASWGTSLERAMLEWVDGALPADAQVTAGSPMLDQHATPLRGGLAEEIAALPGVAHVFAQRVLDVDVGRVRLVLRGVDFGGYLAQLGARGKALRVLDGPRTIEASALREERRLLLSENAAARLGLRAGDPIALPTPRGPAELRVHAVVADYSSDLGVAMLDRRWVVELFGDERVDAVAFLLEGQRGREDGLLEVAARIRALPGGEALYVTSARALRTEISRSIGEFLAIFRAVEWVALVVAVLGVVGAMFAAVLDRQRELALLRALGAGAGQLASALALEAAFLALVAGIGGVLAGLPMGWIFVRVIGESSTGWHLPYDFPAHEALRVVALTIGVAALAGLLVSPRGARTELRRALQED